MIRRIIQIDEDKCNGCGACANACHEGAIGMVNGKAKLLRDDYCDGLGDCLPTCPTGAITFVEREAAAYDEEAVKENMKKKAKEKKSPAFSGCPGQRMRQFDRRNLAPAVSADNSLTSELRQWPVQIKLVAPNAPYFNGCDLLIAADCTAYAYGNFHQAFIKDHITLVGCPKLDAVDYSEKLTQIFTYNDIKRITLTRMTVPCCGGMAMAVQKAIQASGKNIPLKIVIISPDGQIIQTQEM